MDRRREAGDKDALLGAGKDFVEPAAYGAFAGGVSPALNIGGVLKQGQHAAFFAIFRKGMQVKQAVISRRGVYLEVASMDDYTDGGMNGQGNAVHQAVRHLNGIDGKRTQVKAASSPDLTQVGAVQKLMLLQ